MRVSIRQRLRERYAFRCGYCGISETDAGSLLTEDHFQPVRQSGSNSLDNLVYCCHTCNEFKGDWWNPTGEQRILHPLNDPVADHMVLESDGTLRGLTPTGTFHIRRLNLNRPPLVALRLERLERQRRTDREADALERLSRLERHVEQLEAEVERLRLRNRE